MLDALDVVLLAGTVVAVCAVPGLLIHFDHKIKGHRVSMEGDPLERGKPDLAPRALGHFKLSHIGGVGDGGCD